MVQTRAQAATLVVQLQRTAVTQGLMMYGIAAIAAMSFMTSLIVLIAVAAPPRWRGLALFVVAVALLATAIFAVVSAGRKLKRDATVIGDFTRGLKLDLAMINLALKDAETEDEDKLAKREEAKQSVRKAAAEKAATSSTTEQGAVAEGSAMGAAAAAMHAASPTEHEVEAAAKVSAREGSSVDFAQESIATDVAANVAGGAYATAAAPHVAAASTEREIAARSATPPEELTIAGEQERRHGSA
jgi:uncharacterized membrane protein YqjE